VLHDDLYKNDYYQKSQAAVSPLSPVLNAIFQTSNASKPNLSIKAFIATEQRFPNRKRRFARHPV
jgi:formamidopyrimidine-DNA glycosylase